MARDKPERIELPNLLLVEGQDDRRFWDSFLRHHGRKSIQVIEYGSTSELNREFPAIVRTPGFDRIQWLCITEDADLDPDAAFDRICTVLRKEGLPIPPEPWNTALGTPAVATLILPARGQQGDLESLIWTSIQDQLLAGCVNEFLECVRSSGAPMPRPLSKARTYSYLAACHPPGNRLGQAMQAGLFDFDHPAFAMLLELLPAE